jgi:hypothetical protein
VLVCYLDDSGKDPQNRIETVAGYIASDTDWALFETEVEQSFTEYKVKILHAKDLRASRGEFKEWTILKKQAFVARVCQARSPHVMMGMSASALKEPYQIMARSCGRRRTKTAYSFCFNTIIDWTLRDVRIGRAANTEGIGFILESGHENNSEAEIVFHEVKARHKLENILKFIRFADKSSCRAIQVADLLAFYARRDAATLVASNEAGTENYAKDIMLKIITEGVPHYGYISTEFDPEIQRLNSC